MSESLFLWLSNSVRGHNHVGARHCRKPLGRRSGGYEVSTVIIIYIFVTSTYSNIDFHKLKHLEHGNTWQYITI